MYDLLYSLAVEATMEGNCVGTRIESLIAAGEWELAQAVIEKQVVIA